MYIDLTETVGETSVSSGCWGEDSNHELADAVHFHVASSALSFLNRIFLLERGHLVRYLLSTNPLLWRESLGRSGQDVRFPI